MAVLDVRADARRVLDALKDGGIAIIPSDTGYGIAASTDAAVDKINRAKGRGGHKRNALMYDSAGQPDLHRFGSRAQEMVDAVTKDYGLPCGVLGPYNPENPLIEGMSDDMRRTTSALGTVSTLVSAGRFMETLAQMARAENVPVIGSSANLTGTGVKFRVEDIQPEVRDIVDVEIDYGLARYHLYRRSGCIINFETLEVIRFGSCYDLIAGILKRHFKVDLPDDPGVDALPSGHVDEFRLAAVNE